jgi:hypothetical protein
MPDAAAEVAVAGQVERDQRAAERERDGVPGVRVLAAAVQQHELGLGPSPDDRADFLARRREGLAPDSRRAGKRQPRLGGIIGEQPEFVRWHGPCHRRRSLQHGQFGLTRQAAEASIPRLRTAAFSGRVRAPARLGDGLDVTQVAVIASTAGVLVYGGRMADPIRARLVTAAMKPVVETASAPYASPARMSSPCRQATTARSRRPAMAAAS